MDTNELKSAARCIYLATEEKVAQDISRKLIWAADEITSLRKQLAIAMPKMNRDFYFTKDGKFDGTESSVAHLTTRDMEND